MTQGAIDYQVNPRFMPDDIPIWLGNSKDSAIIYDATANELTLQTLNASAVLTDRIRVESGTNTPFVEFVAGKLRLLDANADPGAAGEITRNGADLKVYSGGAVRNLSNIGSGLSNVVEDTTPQLGGNLDAQNNDITNIGAATNDFGTNLLTYEGNTSVVFGATASSSGPKVVLTVRAVTTANADDTQEPRIQFQFTDDTATNATFGELGFRRDGADNTGRFTVNIFNGGSRNLAFEVDSVGELYGDLDGTSGAYFTNGVNLFDEYDDVVEIRRWANTQPAPWVSEQQRLANRRRMVDIGVVIETPASPSGLMYRRTALDRLLAGGIYQNRFRMDEYHADHEHRIQDLEAENRRLKELIHA